MSILESSQLPTRFQRVGLDEAEINAINVCILLFYLHLIEFKIKNIKKKFQSGGAE